MRVLTPMGRIGPPIALPGHTPGHVIERKLGHAASSLDLPIGGGPRRTLVPGAKRQMTETSSPQGSGSIADDHVFISYTHIDNLPFGPQKQHWISLLDEELTTRLKQLVGGEVSVWRDDKLQGNDVFAETLKERLANVQILISVCSPRYLKSEWCQRELDAFVQAAQATRGIQVGTKSRLFKVLKTPVPLEDLPAVLEPLLGYEFYEFLPEGDHFLEYLMNPNEADRWKFYMRLEDLAQDVAKLLGELEGQAEVVVPGGATSDRTVYLAMTTPDMSENRDDLKRELERRGFEVLPVQALPSTVEDVSAAVSRDLSRCSSSIHLLGAGYGSTLEGGNRSITELLLDLAGESATRGGLRQLIWLPDAVEPSDDEQRKLIERLEATNVGESVEVIRAPLHAFKSHVLETIDRAPARASTPPDAGSEEPTVYLIYEPSDKKEGDNLRAELEARGCSVLVPLSEGSEAELREVHQTSMVLSDAVLIYYGRCTEHWVRMRLFDLMKAPGWGRSEPYRATAVWIGAPATPQKAELRAGEILVLTDAEGSPTPAIESFLTLLEEAGPDDR